MACVESETVVGSMLPLEAGLAAVVSVSDTIDEA
jgi:hypothetical protein